MNPLARPYRAPVVGAQFEAFAALLFLAIDQMAEVELGFAAVFGAEFDVLFAAFVVEAQFVVGGGAQHVAFVVLQRDVVAVFGVVQRVGDVRSVRVALFERNRHFGTRQQRGV